MREPAAKVDLFFARLRREVREGTREANAEARAELVELLLDGLDQRVSADLALAANPEAFPGPPVAAWFDAQRWSKTADSTVRSRKTRWRRGAPATEARIEDTIVRLGGDPGAMPAEFWPTAEGAEAA